VYRLQDGKISEIREYCDSVLTETALGRFPEPSTQAAG
jgi:ketosteroid isomerase-like protein